MKALCLIFPDGYGAFFFICQRHTQSQRLFVHLLHHTQMQHPMKVKIEESWRQRLQEEFDKPYFERLVSFVKSEYGRANVLPPGHLIFHVFNSCPFEKVKVVILGQDPYPTPGQYYGICFSVPEGVAIPGSLVNIFREIHQDLGKPIPTSGNLDRWVAQGVFSLNSVLTVRAHETGSHRNMGWETFTDAVIKKLSDEREHLVFMLWGAYAKEKAALIDRSKHLILTTVHPSPRSAEYGFFGCKCHGGRYGAESGRESLYSLYRRRRHPQSRRFPHHASGRGG